MHWGTMRLTLEWNINNELKIQTQTDPYAIPKRTDSAHHKRTETQGNATETLLYNNRLLQRIYHDGTDYVTVATHDGMQGDLFGKPTPVNPHTYKLKVLPETYRVVDRQPSGRFSVETRATDEVVRERNRALDIISKSQEPSKKHSSHGRVQTVKRFTRASRGHLLRAGAVIDKQGLKEVASLLTLTIPGGTDEAFSAVSRWSGWIVNRQLQAVRDYMKRRPVHWFFVWEWQGRGALHQHWCVVGKDYDESKHLSMLLKDAWYQCLKEIGKKEKIDLFLRCNRKHSWKNNPGKWVWNEQKVEKSVAKYFAKYASKQMPDEAESKGSKWKKIYYPSRWHGTSKTIKNIIKQHHIKLVVPGISEDECFHLIGALLLRLQPFEVTQSYNYDFRIEGQNQRCIVEGQATILYFADSQYRFTRAAVAKFCGSPHSRVKNAAPYQWELQAYAVDKLGLVSGLDLPYMQGVGMPVIFR